MHMTLEADYAVRIVEFLAAANQKVDARTICGRNACASALCPEDPAQAGGGRHHDFLQRRPRRVHVGASGGGITLRRVIESVEGPYMISRCQQGEYACTHTASCRFHEIYNEISEIVRQKLDSYTFADVSGAGHPSSTEKS